MTDKKQTAVEQLMPNVLGLILQLSNNRISQRTCELQILELFEQAKQMEHEQITGAWEDGFENGYNDGKYDDEPYYNNSELYYNMTYTDIKI